MGSEGSVSGGGGGAYRLVRSRSLNFFPIKDRALSTCCCVPAERPQGEAGELAGGVQGAWDIPLTLYVTDLEVLCVRQRGDVDLCPRVLLQEADISALLPDQPPHQGLRSQSGPGVNEAFAGTAARFRPLTLGTSISQTTSSELEDAAWLLCPSEAPMVQPLSTESMLFTSEPGRTMMTSSLAHPQHQL